MGKAKAQVGDVANNSLRGFYATEAQFALLTNITERRRFRYSPPPADFACSDAHGKVLRIERLAGTLPVCVLPNPKTASAVDGATWAGAIGAVVAVAAAIILYLVCRSRAQAKLQAQLQEQNATLLATSAPKHWYEESTDDAAAYYPIVESVRLHYDARFDEFLAPYRIPVTDLERHVVIARGGFGVVYHATLRGIESVAMKRMLPHFIESAGAIEEFMQEIRLYAHLMHPKIVQFIGVTWTTLYNISMVTEFMPYGDVWSLLEANASVRGWHERLHREPILLAKSALGTPSTAPNSNSDGTEASPKERRGYSGPVSTTSAGISRFSILTDVVEAMIYLHGFAVPVIHRDIKARNVLLGPQYEAKLTDFGTSRLRVDELTMTAEIGTSAWIAPEVLKGIRYTEKADIYSFGVMMTELDTVEVPYAKVYAEPGCTLALARARIAMLVAAGDIVPEFSAECPAGIAAIGAACLAHDPETRPCSSDLAKMLQQVSPLNKGGYDVAIHVTLSKTDDFVKKTCLCTRLEYPEIVNFDDSVMVLGVLFCINTFLAYGQLPMVPVFIASRLTFYKQRAAGFFPTLAFVLAQSLAPVPFLLLETLLCGTLVYWVAGFSAVASTYVTYLLLLFALNLTFAMWFFFVAAASPSLHVADPVSLLTILITVVFAGFVIPSASLPSFTVWIFWLNPLAWCIRGLAINEYTSPEYSVCEFNGIDYCTRVNATFGDAQLRQFDLPTDRVWIWYVAVPIAMPTIDIPPVTLAFKDLYYLVPNPTKGEPDLELLKGVSGFALPGTITALMGSSGAGKTTLMDVISGRKTGGTIKGSILLNGYPATDLAIRRATGYCEQTDVHSEATTFREALQFSALLRQSSAVPTPAKLAYVEHCLELLDLGSLADTLVRGSSVEQMKRLTIGVELAAAPSILFLDEPTSGLDARSAKIVMSSVRQIASTGRTVVCTIHQPSADVFEMFDALLLLQRGGHTVYFGNLGPDASRLVGYLSAIPGTPALETGTNPATWMLDVITGAGIDYPSAFKMSPEREALEEALVVHATVHPSRPEVAFGAKRAASTWTQSHLITQRFFRMYWRTPAFTNTRFFIAIVLAVLFGIVYVGADYTTFTGANAGVGMVYVTTTYVGYIAFNSVIGISTLDRPAFYRERAAQTYSAFAYFVGTTLVEVPYAVATTFLFTIIFYPFVGFHGSVQACLAYASTLSLSVLLYVYMGQFMAYALPTIESAVLIGVLMNSIFFLFYGYLPTASTIPDAYRWLYTITPPKYAMAVLTAETFATCNKADDWGCHILQDAPPTLLRDGPNVTVKQFVETTYEMRARDTTTNVAAVVGFIVLFRLLAVFVNQSTFTTYCPGITFTNNLPTYVVPDQPSCIWYPNGTVWRGANKTTFFHVNGTEVIATGNLKNAIWGGIEFDQVDYLPSKVPVVALENVGIKSLRPAYTHDVHGDMLGVISLYLRYNKLTEVNVEFTSNLQELSVSFNRISTINIVAQSLWKLLLASNKLTSVPPAITQLRSLKNFRLLTNNLITSIDGVEWPFALTTLILAGNAITEVHANFPPEITILYINTAVSGRLLETFLGNNITAFYVNQQQFALLSTINESAIRSIADISHLPLFSNISTSTCRGQFTVRRLLGKYDVCYVSEPTNSHAVRIGVPAVVGLVVAAVLVTTTVACLCVRKRDEMRRARAAKWYDDDDGRFFAVADSTRLYYDVRFDDALREFRIPVDDLERDVVIAKGGFGVVYRATLRGETPVAMKRMLPTVVDSAEAVDEFMKEIRLYAQLTHPKIVQFVGIAWSTLHNISMVTEFMPHGDVWSLVEANKDAVTSWLTPMRQLNELQSRPRHHTSSTQSSTMSELLAADATIVHSAPRAGASRLAIVTDVADALAYLHSFATPVIHRDIKARNVLLGPQYEAKLTDFGTSRLRMDELTMTAEIGTTAWIAPEVLKGVRYTEKADIYSFGVMMSELDTVEVPYSSVYLEPGCTLTLARARIAMLVSTGEIVPSFTEACPGSIVAVARRCLAFNPEGRPTAQELAAMLQHEMKPPITTALGLLTVAIAAAYDVNLDPRRATASGPVVRVAASTFTTDCTGVVFAPQADFVVPDQPSCVWYPNGTVWRGANKTDEFMIGSQRVNRTGNVKNAVYGGMTIDVLGILPTKAPVVVLDNVGLRQLNTSLSVGIDGINVGVLALYLWNNNLTNVVSTFNGDLQELYLANNSISSVRIQASGLNILDLTGNDLNDATLNASFLPPTMSILSLGANALTKVPLLARWPQLATLHLYGNAISEVVADFPPSLQSLSFAENPITAFYANASQFALLEQVNETIKAPTGWRPHPLFTTITNTSCRKHLYTRLLFDKYPICLLPDTASGITAAPATHLSWGLLSALILLAIAVTAAAAYVIVRRRKPRTKWYDDDDGQFFAVADSSRLYYDVRFDDALREFRIPVDDLERDVVIAKGGFGVVYRATLRGETPVAMKRMLPTVVDSAEAVDEFMKEIRLYAQLTHPKIVQFVGIAWSTLHNISMVTEFMPHGDVWSLVEANKDAVTSWFEPMVQGGVRKLKALISSRRRTASSQSGSATESGGATYCGSADMLRDEGATRMAIVTDVADALVYLHSFATPVIHRDIKARNVLLGPQYEAKLTDFGTSRLRMDELTMTAEIGTSAWIAPEVLKGVRYTEKADIYSFGVMMAELDTVEVPYSNVYLEPGCTLALARARIAMLVATGEIAPTFTKACPAGIVTIARACLAHQPEDRPTASELTLMLREQNRKKHGNPRLGTATTNMSVTQATFTTLCDGVVFPADPTFAVPDQPSCVWYPNGTVWRGANKTTESIFGEKTGNIKNSLIDTPHVDFVAFLPNQAPVTVLANLGISRLNRSFTRDCENIRLETSALYIPNNNLTNLDVAFASPMVMLDARNNQISSVNVNASGLTTMWLSGNPIVETTFDGSPLPPALVEMYAEASVARNNNPSRTMSYANLKRLPTSVLIPSLQRLRASNNSITSIGDITWPSGMTEITLENNSISSVVANFPPTLRTLSLYGNPIVTFYANTSQFKVLSKLANWQRTNESRPVVSVELSGVSCRGHIGVQAIPNTSLFICILPDDKTASWSTIIGVGVGVLVLVVFCTVVVVRLRRQRRLQQQWWYHETADDAEAAAETERLHHDVRFDDRLQALRIPVEDLERDVVLARGGFGVVYLATLRKKERVAMKRLLPTFVASARAIDEFMHEIRIYSTLSHDNIVAFKGVAWSNSRNITIVMEYMPYSDVWSLLLKNKWVTSWHQKMQHDSMRGRTTMGMVKGPDFGVSKMDVARSIAAALSYLHGLDTPVIHRDIKARNVLLGPEYEAKLTDFGTSRLRVDDLTMTAEIGTAAWIAPEVLKGIRYTEKADIYSFGVMMSELDTTEIPYANMFMEPGSTLTLARTRIAMLVVNGELRPGFRNQCPSRVARVARRCLSFNPEHRPTAVELCELLAPRPVAAWGLLLASLALGLDVRQGLTSEVYPVTEATFTTHCDNITWSEAAYEGDYIPDQTSCVWYPDGTVWRGAVKTYSSRQGTTGWIKNTLDGSMTVEFVAFLPNTAAVIKLDNLGIKHVNESLNTDIHGVPLVAKTIQLMGNQITIINITLSDTVTMLNLRDNKLTDASFASGPLPPSVNLLDMSNNSLTQVPPQVLTKDLVNISLNNNAIQSIDGVEWPRNLQMLSLWNNSIRQIHANFPATLTHLCLAGNPISAFYANQSQFNLLSKLLNPAPTTVATSNDSTISVIDMCGNVLSTTLTSVDCAGHASTKMLFGVFPICLVADAASPSSIPTSTIVILALSLALLGVLGCLFYRMCHKKKWFEETEEPPVTGLADSCRLYHDVRFEEAFQAYRIPATALERRRILARGGFGIVYLAAYHPVPTSSHRTYVAMKRLLPSFVDNPHAIDEFMQEIRVYAQLTHPKVVQFVGITWTTLYNMSIVTEYMPYGDVWSLLLANPKVPSWEAPMIADSVLPAKDIQSLGSAHSFTGEPWRSAPTISSDTSSCFARGASKLGIAMDMVEAMMYLHGLETPVIHRDIKARNILLGPHYEAKLTDFGTSRAREDEMTMTAEIGTAAWIAPEVLKGIRYGEKADIYSFGVLLSELDTGEVPYSHVYLEPGCTVTLARTRIAMMVVGGEIAPRFTLQCPSGIYEIARQCLAYNPDDRPDATELYDLFQEYQHFFESI
ncbi:ATP-binding Cassette (ABC) Superfamily [Achlya hypogyna]|uniref:ATP-binding Cassette (ABC) Superfamily n=1 Tax=Achlya hypogyna TaxID=1202772 RepID=A0A1V9YGA7_ACHHY|nr:ATP-binding Cassette (ABC) Superfamily [Achlya hypogyna]